MISIYNSTKETVEISLRDTKNRETTAILKADKEWSKHTEDGWNSIIIIPLDDSQNTFIYTLKSGRGMIIKRKLNQLVLVPSEESPRSEMDITLNGHKCKLSGTSPGPGGKPVGRCLATGCIVFNESEEPVKICVTDNYFRNTHMILAHGEHNIVKTPKKPSFVKKLLNDEQAYSETILVSVLDFNSKDDLQTTSKAKYSSISFMHDYEDRVVYFFRVTKKDQHLTIDQDSIRLDKINGFNPANYSHSEFSYLLSEKCCRKVKSMKGNFEVITTPEGEYDVVPARDDCCIA